MTTVSLQELGWCIKRLQSRNHRLLDAHLGEIGSTLAQWDALRAIRRSPNASSHDLAEATFQTDQSFGALANRLVDRGLITRVPGKGRALLHRLTAEGTKMLRQGNAVAEKMHRATFAPLSEGERAQLLALIQRLLPQQDLETDQEP